MLNRREKKIEYTPQEVKSRLTWLAKQLVAHHQIEFYLERIQISWIPNKWLRLLAPTLLLGSVYGLLVTLIFGVFNGILYGSTIGFVTGTILGCFIALLYVVINSFLFVCSEREKPSQKQGTRISFLEEISHGVCSLLENRLIYGLTFGCFGGLLCGLMFGALNSPFFFGKLVLSISYGLFYGLYLGIGFGILGTPNKQIQPAEIIRWSWSQFRRRLLLMICLALLLGSVYGLLYQQIARFLLSLVATLIFGLMGGVSNASLENAHLLSPNQGIWRSARNSLISGMIACFGSSLPVSIGSVIFYEPFYGLLYGVSLGLMFGLWVTFQHGGIACLQHLSVRLVLWQMGTMPRKYAHFLDYASKQILLTKVGGGYIFIHRLLLEYFATLDTDKNQQMQPIGEPIHLSRRFVLAGSFTVFLSGSVIALTKALQAIPFSLQPGMPLYLYKKHTGFVRSLAWAPNGQYLLSAGDDATVRVWYALNGKEFLVLRGYTGIAAWSPDGKYIALGSNDGTIQVWDVHQKSLVLTYQGHIGYRNPSGITWSPDGKYIASGGSANDDDGMLRIWESLSGHTLTVDIFKHIDVAHTVWSPDGTYIALGCNNGAARGTVQIWDAKKGEVVWRFSDHTDSISSIAWGPDGRHIASSSLDTTVRIWSINDREASLTIHQDTPVYSVSWSPDGNYLVTGGRFTLTTSPVWVWSTSDGRKILGYRGHGSAISAVAWSPNGQFIASANTFPWVEVWKAPYA